LPDRLLDSNVLCEASQAHPDPTVLPWLADNDAELHVSVLSLGEMLKGIHLMAATALQHDLTIVTRNTTDFPDDVPLLNPWPA
jgi:predicted nucleic acid-binding protein